MSNNIQADIDQHGRHIISVFADCESDASSSRSLTPSATGYSRSPSC